MIIWIFTQWQLSTSYLANLFSKLSSHATLRFSCVINNIFAYIFKKKFGCSSWYSYRIEISMYIICLSTILLESLLQPIGINTYSNLWLSLLLYPLEKAVFIVYITYDIKIFSKWAQRLSRITDIIWYTKHS